MYGAEKNIKTNRHPIIPNHYFSYVSSECQLLFDSGYYFGCIALCQSVAEALARFMYEKWTGKQPADYFKDNISKMEGVQPDVRNLLKDIYGGQQRNDFHHLNKTVPTEYTELKNIATKKIALLNEVESKIFEYDFTEKGLNPKYPKYWESVNSSANVFLRFQH